MIDKDFGNVYEAEAKGAVAILEIYFPEAKSVEEIDAVAYGIKNGTAKRNTTAISQGKLVYDVLTGYFTCLCPFDDVDSWKLFIWRRNEALNKRILSWSEGKTIPVSQIVNEINLLKQRVEDHTTNIARALKAPEEGSLDLILPPKEVRSGKILGFDNNGFPTAGEDCEQVKKLINAEKACKNFVSQAEMQAKEAKRQAEISGTYSYDASKSAKEAKDHASTAKMWAKNAEGQTQKVKEAGTAFSHDASIAAGKAQQSAEDAEASAVRAEEATNTVIGGLKDLDKKLCYVGCAVKRVENADKNVIQSTEAAEMSATSAGQSAMTAQQMATVATSKAKEAEEYAAQMSRVYKYCGTVATQAELPTSGNTLGDVWNVADTGQNYAWDGTAWDALGRTVNYATTEEFEALQATVDAKANDADVVHKSGNETITGLKCFEGSLMFGDAYPSHMEVAGVGFFHLKAENTINSSRYKFILSNVNIDGVTNSRLRKPTVFYIRGGMNGELLATTNDFSNGNITELSILPLGTTTALGAPAYGLHVSATGGLQLFGTHFLNGDIWTDDSVKMVKGNVSLTSTDTASIGFDYANKVVFRTMPNDGTEATYELEAWQWDDDSHTTKSASAGVKFLKPSQKSALESTSVLNMQEGDARWLRKSFPPYGKDYFYDENGNIVGSIGLGDNGLTLCFDPDTADSPNPIQAISLNYEGRLAFRAGGEFISLPNGSGTIALDEDVVHLSGDETITGIKTFSNGTVSGAIKFDEYGISIDFDNLGVSMLGSLRGAPCFRVYGKEVLVPTSKSGIIALTSDIPDVSGYLSTTGVENGNLIVGTVLSVGNHSSYAPFYVDIYPYDSSLAIEFPMQSGRALIPYKDGDNTVAFTSDVSAVDLTKGGTINGELVVESNNPLSIEANGEIQAYSGNFSYLYVSNTATIENVGNYEASIPNIKYLNENFSRRDNTILGSGASGTDASNPVGVAIGENAKATGGGKTAEATAVGARASATGACSTAIGRDTTASDCMTVALGADASATKNNSTALGAQSSASNEYSTAVGDGAKALGFASTAVGSNVENFLDSSTLVGTSDPSSGKGLSIGVVNDDNPGFLFVEQNENATLTGVRISKENFMAMLKQFGGEDFTATKPAEEQATE